MKQRGFTLIELLVVIAIIALLTTIILASIAETYRHARNTERIQEIRQIMIALELARSTEGHYPCAGITFSTDPGDTFLEYLVNHDYITDTPKDPINDINLAYSDALWPYAYISYSDLDGQCGQVYHLEFTTETAKPLHSSCNIMGGSGIWIGDPATHCHMFYPTPPPCDHDNYFIHDSFDSAYTDCVPLMDDEHGSWDNYGY